MHYKLTKWLCTAEYQSGLGFHCAHNSLCVIFFGSSLSWRLGGEVRSEAAGTGPDVKPAPQWNGFPGESKVKLSWGGGIWKPKELSDHHNMRFKGFKLILPSWINSTTGTGSDITVAICTETQTTGFRKSSMLKLKLIFNYLRGFPRSVSVSLRVFVWTFFGPQDSFMLTLVSIK